MKNQPILIKGKIQLSGLLIFNEKEELMLLHRKDHKHYETPGGKVEVLDCEDSKKPTKKDFLNAAIREAFEELGQEFIFEEPEYIKGIEFIMPNEKQAVAHKFKTKIVFGEPKINEPETFDEIKWFTKKNLEENKEKLSPDLKLFLEKKLI